MFWLSAEDGLCELCRVLTPGGRLVVVLREHLEDGGRFDRSRIAGVPDEKIAEVEPAGFHLLDRRSERLGKERYTALVAER